MSERGTAVHAVSLGSVLHGFNMKMTAFVQHGGNVAWRCCWHADSWWAGERRPLPGESAPAGPHRHPPGCRPAAELQSLCSGPHRMQPYGYTHHSLSHTHIQWLIQMHSRPFKPRHTCCCTSPPDACSTICSPPLAVSLNCSMLRVRTLHCVNTDRVNRYEHKDKDLVSCYFTLLAKRQVIHLKRWRRSVHMGFLCP